MRQCLYISAVHASFRGFSKPKFACSHKLLKLGKIWWKFNLSAESMPVAEGKQAETGAKSNHPEIGGPSHMMPSIKDQNCMNKNSDTKLYIEIGIWSVGATERFTWMIEPWVNKNKKGNGWSLLKAQVRNHVCFFSRTFAVPEWNASIRSFRGWFFSCPSAGFQPELHFVKGVLEN